MEAIKSAPTAWILPIICSIPTIYLICCKGFYETTSKLTYLGAPYNWLLVLFRQIAQFGFLGVAHYWVDKKIFDRFKISHIYPNCLFYGIYFEIFGFTLYDFDYSRINMQQTLPSIFTAYVGRFGGQSKLFVPPIYNIPNGKTKSVEVHIVYQSILDSPGFWASTISIILIWFILQGYYLYFKRDEILSSTIKGLLTKSKSPGKEYFDHKTSILSRTFKTTLFKIYHILFVIYIILLFETFFIPSDTKTSKFSTIPYFEGVFLAFSHFEKRLPRSTQKQFLELVRSYLPPGRRWLDNRPNPIYPAVHGDMQAFCAYNPNEAECKNYQPPKQKPLIKQMPNVLVLIYESLTPSYLLISKEYIREHTSIKDNDPKQLITNTSYYNPEIMPNLHKYQKYGITFSGLSSHGIPTSSGWHSLMTSIPPSQTYLNIIDGSYIHSDDLPSQMRNYGYRSISLSSTLPEFDGARNWVWRRPAKEEAEQRLRCKEAFGDLINDTKFKELIGENNFPKLKTCTKEEVEKLTKKMKKIGLDFPKWYDYVLAYLPRKDNAKALGIDPNTIPENTTWSADRFTSQEFIIHWKQNRDYLNRTGQNKPIFGTYLSIESHLPYYGYDQEQFYEEIIPITKNMNSEQKKEARFLRVNKYADKYQIGKVLDWLKENDPNTIFIITGDHGTRDIPIHDSDSPIFDNIVFSSDCVHHSSGIDSFYVTSGMIGYLGDDPKIKEILKLNELSGKTIKTPTDHNDLIYTIEDILNKLNGTNMQPTHRRNRNLIDYSYKILNDLKDKSVNEIRNDIDKTGWNSFSLTTFNAEFRDGTSLLRTHTGDENGAHFYQHVSYPTCLRNKSVPPMKLGTEKAKEKFKKMFKHISVETYLTYNNRLYNYDFRDNKCIEKGKCEFGQPLKLKLNDDFFMEVITGIPIIIMLLFGVITEVIGFAFYTFYHNKPDEIELDPKEKGKFEEEESSDSQTLSV